MERYVRSNSMRSHDRVDIAETTDASLNCYVVDVAMHSTDPEELAELANINNHENVKYRLVSNEYTPEDIAQRLCVEIANNWRWEFREAVAARTQDRQLSYQLASDKDWRVRRTLAAHTQYRDILEESAEDEDPNVVREVAKRIEDSRLLDSLASHPSWMVREVVAKRTNNQDTLLNLSEDENDIVSYIANKRSVELGLSE